MTYLSVCSGIEAASVAWGSLGWQPWAFAEVEAFPSAVLAAHYPDVPNLGDMTRFQEWPDAAFDLLVGGTPCQSFSVAGLREGLADPRGGLLRTYLEIARRYRPGWVVWENVPGVLSIDDGRAFGSLLGGLVELGYGVSYRVLDAQHFGLAQRRRRVFVVGCLGDWRRAAAVLFERASLSGHPAPRREAGQSVARPIAAGSPRGSGYRNDADTAENLIPETAGTLGGSSQSGGFRTTDLDNSGAFIPEIAPTLAGTANGGGANGPGRDADSATSLIVMSSGQANAEIREDGGAPSLTCLHEAPIVAHAYANAGHFGAMRATAVADPLRADGGDTGHGGETLIAHAFKASHYTRGKDGAPSEVAPPLSADADKGDQDTLIAFDTTQITSRDNRSNPQPGDPCHPLAAGAHPPAVAFDARQSDVIIYGDKSGPLDTDGHTTGVLAYAMRADAGRSGEAKTPSADAAGRVRLRDAGFNVQTEQAPTLDATAPHSVAHGMTVRRLTPRECERLQGFPDDYTAITYRGKPAADGPRYKALGNSMAVPVMRWIGERIALVDAIPEGGK